MAAITLANPYAPHCQDRVAITEQMTLDLTQAPWANTISISAVGADLRYIAAGQADTDYTTIPDGQEKVFPVGVGNGKTAAGVVKIDAGSYDAGFFAEISLTQTRSAG